MNALTPIDTHFEHTICAIHLHGELAARFGPTISVPGSTVSSAVRNMLIRSPGMVNVFEKGRYRVVRGSLSGGIDLDEDMLHMRIGPTRQIHIFPVADGGGGNRGGTLKTVLGAVIIIAAVALIVAQPYLAPILGPTLTAALPGIASSIAIFGASLLLGGISRLIAPQPGLGASYLLNGNTNTAVQGTPVPLVYGRARVGSVVIATSYSAEDYNTTTSNYKGSASYVNSTGGYSGALDAFDTGNPLPPGASGKGGGGKGGGGGGGVEAPNTLESKSIIRLIDIVSEGPITGFVGGAESIFFNNTPLMNADGTFNFRGVTWYYLFGFSDQAPIPGYPSVTETVQVNTQVFYSTPVIQQLQSTTATQARITIELPALYATNTQNGDINPSNVGLLIEVAEVVGTSVGAYSTAVSDNISGKCTSAYQRSYVFDLPGSGPGGTITAWNIRITKQTPESAVSTTINQLYWSSYDLIANYQLMYPDSAGIAFEFDAEAFGSNLPARSFLIDGIQVQVPANYNASNGTYATTGVGTAGGSWDFVTFQAETTSNPAWVLYDFLSNNRYGLGLPASALEMTAVQLYPIAQYADGQVPDGNGATERRYALNGVFNQRADAFKLMQAIAATFRGQVYWAGGQVGVTADMPQNPVKIYTAANVISGNFVYEGTSLKTRHTTANVHFTDPANQYLPGIEITELPPQVAQRGIFPAEMLGFGVTSRGLAHRAGNWLLYTENFQIETVTFSVAWDSAGVLPGNLIQIADINIAGIRMGGRLRSNSTLSALALDMTFVPVAGQAYTITVVLEDGTLAQNVTVSSFQQVTFTNPANMSQVGATYTQVNLATPLTVAPLTGGVYVLQDATVPLTEWQIVGISETNRGIFEIIAVAYNPQKYALVENIPTLEVPAFSTVPTGLIAPLPPPTNVSGLSSLAGQGLTTLVLTVVSWTIPNDARIVQYQVSVVNSAGTTVEVLTPTGSSVSINNLSPDTYYFAVRSLGSNGSTSAWAYSAPLVVTGLSNNAPAQITGLNAIPGVQSVFLQWNASSQQDVAHYNVWRSSGTIAPHQSGTLAVLVTTLAGTSFTDSDAQTLTVGTTWNYWVEAVTTTGVVGVLSAAVSAQIAYVVGSMIATGAIASINQFASNITPVTVWSGVSLPASPTNISGGTILIWTVDNQVYRWNGTAWTTSVNTSSLAGTIPGSTIAGNISGATIAGSLVTGSVASANNVAATGITGTIAASQVAAIPAAQISGTLAAAQIASLTAGQITGALTASQIASVNAAAIAGTISASQIAAIPAAQISGTLLAAQIASVNASAVGGTLVGSQIAAGTIQASNIASGTITTAQLAVGAPSNVIWNSCCNTTTDGWNNTNLYPLTGSTVIEPVSGLPFSAFAQGSAGGAYEFLSCPTLGSPNYTSSWWAPTGAPPAPYVTQYGLVVDTPCVPGQAYAAQALVLSHNVVATVVLIFTDAAGNILSNTDSHSEKEPAYQTVGGVTYAPSLSNWNLLWANAVAPANAAFMGMHLWYAGPAANNIIVGYTETAANPIVVSNPTITFTSNGSGGDDIGPDIFSYCYTQVTGNFVATAQVTSISATTGKIGLLLRDSLIAEGCTQVNANCVYQNGGVLGRYADFSSNGDPDQTTVANFTGVCYVKIQRAGNVITLAYSRDNSTWTTLATLTPATLNKTLYIGGALFSYGGASTGVLTNVLINATPWMAFTQAALGSSVPNASAPPPWVPGGVTQISGGQILTGSITAGAIAAGTITGTQIAANTITGGNIVGGTITAGNIAAATITGTNIAAGTIQAANIAAGTITAAQIAAAAITTAQLAVGSSNNIIYNPCLTLSPAGWFNSSGTDGYSQISIASVPSSSPYYMQSQGAGHLPCVAFGPGTYGDICWGPNLTGNGYFAQTPVIAGQTYEWQVLLLSSLANTSAQLYILWNSADFSSSSAVTGGQIVISTASPTSNSAWTQLGVIATAPAGMAYAGLLLRVTNTSGATATYDVYFTRALFAQTVPNATQLSPWSAGGVTQIDGSQINTGSITASQIAANSITTSRLTAGSGANVVSNPSCAVGTFGWTTNGPCVLRVSTAAFVPSEGAGELFAASLPNNTYIYSDWSPAGGFGVACTPGTWVEAQALIGVSGCVGWVELDFFNSSGTKLSDLPGPNVTTAPSASLSGWTKSYAITQVPVGAATVSLRIVGLNVSGATVTNAYVSWCQAYLGLTVAGATQPAMYSPGGITSINGAMIATGSISAQQIAAGTITATQIAAGAITTTQLAANSVTAGNIAAGVLSASNITSGTLNAGVILGSLANFGTVQITNAQIANLTVTTSLIANNAVSNYQYAKNVYTGSAVPQPAMVQSFTVTTSVTNPSVFFLMSVEGDYNTSYGSGPASYSGG